MKLEHESVPAPGQARPVCDGIQWLRMPLPFALDHVNCWLLGEGPDRVLVDTGVDDDLTKQYWRTFFDAKDSYPQQLLVTHFHPDHIGLAGWFEQNGCKRFMGSEIETAISLGLSVTSDQAYASLYELWYLQNGLPELAVSTVRRYGNTYNSRVFRPPASDKWQFITQGQTLTLAGRDYTVLIGRGHAPDMIMLYRSDDRVLIAADQVLPSISPNVSVMPRLDDTNPLGSFLDTLAQLEQLPEDTLVLPSHGVPFRGLRVRIEQLKHHHELRLSEVLKACVEPITAFELFPTLYKRKLDAQQTAFALGEALSHLHYLEQAGQIQRHEKKGVIRFVAISG